MSDFMPREWRFYIDDMIGFAEKVIAHTVAAHIALASTMTRCGASSKAIFPLCSHI
jgi:hypothetical protein